MPMMRKVYRGVAAGDALHQKETPARPWEQPEQRDKRNAAPEVDDHLSDLGIYLRDKLRALMAYLSSGNGKHE